MSEGIKAIIGLLERIKAEELERMESDELTRHRLLPSDYDEAINALTATSGEAA